MTLPAETEDVVAGLAHRAPHEHLNYPGDCTTVDPEIPLGPTDSGQQVWPVTATYDADSDRTRVGLSFFPPPLDV